MFFKNIDSWSQKNLKLVNVLFNVLYFLLTFIAPITTVIWMFYQNGSIKEQYKFPIAAIIICAAVLIAAIRFLKNTVSKIKILNIDGSYNHGAQILKHILEFVCKALVPVILLIVSCLFATTFKQWIDFYNQLIIVCLSFFIAGMFVDAAFLSFLDDELEIRDKVAEQNAISKRISLR